MDCTKRTVSYIGPRGSEIMSFAYIQGQEAQAVAYFKILLQAKSDPAEREELKKLIEKLEKEISQQQPHNGNPQTAHNLPCNLVAA